MQGLRKVYDCETLEEIIDFLAVRLGVDRRFVHIEDDQIYVGNVHCRNLVLEHDRHWNKEIGPAPWITLYTKDRGSKKKVKYL